MVRAVIGAVHLGASTPGRHPDFPQGMLEDMSEGMLGTVSGGGTDLAQASKRRNHLRPDRDHAEKQCKRSESGSFLKHGP